MRQLELKLRVRDACDRDIPFAPPNNIEIRELSMIIRIGFLIALLLTSGLTSFAETWTTLNGQNFDAQFRGMWGDAAIFERADGKRAAITLLNMNAESRIRLEKLNKEVEARRAERVEQLRNEATEAAMQLERGESVGGSSAALPAPVPYQPITDSMDLQATVAHLLEQTASGHLRIYWDALPPSYQQQTDQMRVDLTGKVPAEKWDSRIAVLEKIVRIVREKQTLLLNSSALATVPQPMKDSAVAAITPFVDQLATILGDNRFSHASISTTPIGDLIAAISTEVSGPLRKMLEASEGQSKQLPTIDRMEIQQTDDSHGTVKELDSGDSSTWSRIEQRWVSDAATGDWQQKLAAANGQLQQVFGPAGDATVAQFTPVLDGLLAASDQAAFDAVVFQIIAQLAPMMQQMGGAPGAPGGF